MKNKINLKDFSPIQSHKQKKHTTCPARDKQTGKCYGKVYFEAKYGKPEVCLDDKCKWLDKFKDKG